MTMKNYISYYRVSRKEQGISGLGLAAQKNTVLNYIQSQSGILVNEYTEVETGTKKKERVEIQKAIQEAKETSSILVIAKLDRLARNVNFVSSLMDSGIQFIACDMPSANNFTIHIFAAMAEAEAQLNGIRTRQALQELRNRGVCLGKPENLTNEARAKGLRVIKENAINNDRNRQAQTVILSCKEKGMSYRKIAEYLNNLNFKTRYDKQFLAASVLQLYKRIINPIPIAA